MLEKLVIIFRKVKMATTGVQEDAALITLVYRYYSDTQLEPNLPAEQLELILKQIKAIRAYAQEEFPSQTLLSDEELVILSLSIFSPHPSPEKGIIATDRNYMEVKRTLSRFYCISLLQQGEQGYASFIAVQDKEAEFNPILKKEEFLQLAKKYQSLDKLTLDTLKLATLISSVPLSSEARKRADKVIDKYIVDSVEFPAQIFEDIDIARKVYPQVAYFWQQHPSAEEREVIKSNLQSAFSHRRHYRHMLYTEGSYAMFNTIVSDVKAGKLSKDAYTFWVLYWNTNITGFQGNVEPRGSFYLTSNTFRAMSALESVLDVIFEDSTFLPSAILTSYLTQRAAFLGLGEIRNTDINLNIKDQEFLAHIGAMMRLYHPEQGQLLSASYHVRRKDLSELRKDFYVSDDTMPTPTYAPALFANVKDCLLKRYDEDKVFRSSRTIRAKQLNMTADKLKLMLAIFETLILCLPLYLAALNKYKQLRKEAKIDPHVPLSFQSIADPKWITQLFDKSIILDKVNILELIEITVSDKGVVAYEKRLDYDQRLKAQVESQEIEGYADPVAVQSRTVLTAYNDKSATPLVPVPQQPQDQLKSAAAIKPNQ